VILLRWQIPQLIDLPLVEGELVGDAEPLRQATAVSTIPGDAAAKNNDAGFLST
jgi:hypothetical protein